jgi:hypothetical protein
MTDSNFAKLRELLLNEFSEAEVTSLCQDVGLNYENLPGTGLFGKTRGLLEVAQRNGRLRSLQARIRELRPDGYAALGIGTVSETAGEAVADAASMADSVSRETNGAPRRLQVQLIPVLLVGLIGVLLLASFLWTRSIGGNAAAADAQAAQTAAAVVAAAQPTGTSIPVVVEPAISVSETVGAAGGAPVAISTPTSADGVVVIATNVVPVNTPLPTIAVIGGETITTSATAARPVVVDGTGENHPAALAFKDMNALLPQFYRGEIGAEALRQEWTGKAYDALTAFSDRQLPRALQLGTAARTTMDISYEYIKQPSVIKSAGNTHTILSREYWRYGNQASGVVRCDTRDYTYVVVADGGAFTVTDFSSKIVENGCK